MVKIRLKRFGTKKRPYFRVVALDQRRSRDSRALEYLGTYNPLADPSEIHLKDDRIEAWLAQGAQLSSQVKHLLKHFRNKVSSKSPPSDATGEV